MDKPLEIFLARDGQTRGPYSVEQLRGHLAEGSISPVDLAWYEGAANWMPVSELPLNDATATQMPSVSSDWTNRPIKDLISIGICIAALGFALMIWSLTQFHRDEAFMAVYVGFPFGVLMLLGGLVGYLFERRTHRRSETHE